MTRNESAIKKDLGYEWKKLKRDSGASPEEKAAAKVAIVRLQKELKQIVPSTEITDFEAQDAAYKAKKASEKEDSSPKSTYSDEKKSVAFEDPANYEFTTLDEDEQTEITLKVKRLFETKVIVMNVAKEFGKFGFDNGASVGQILSILNQ